MRFLPPQRWLWFVLAAIVVWAVASWPIIEEVHTVGGPRQRFNKQYIKPLGLVLILFAASTLAAIADASLGRPTSPG